MGKAPTPAPFYEERGISIYHGDSAEILPRLRVKANLIVTDPPYGVRYRASSMRRRALPREKIHGDDGKVDVPAILSLALRCLVGHGHLYVFGPFTLQGLSIASHVKLVWAKGPFSVGNVDCHWGLNWEPIQFAIKSTPRARELRRGCLAARKRRGAVLNIQRLCGPQVKHHLTEKPVRLMRMLVESSSVEGDLVLDPFMGSGPTLLAAAMLGRRAIGIEIDRKYCEIAARRLEKIWRHVDALKAA